MATEDPGLRIQAAIVSSGAAIAPPLLGVLEATRVEPLSFVDGTLGAVYASFVGCGGSIAFLALLGLPTLLSDRHIGWAAFLQGLLACGFGALLLIGLWADDVIAGYWATWVALVAMVLAFPFELWLRTKWPWTNWLVAVATTLGAGGMWFANYTFVTGAYAEVHWAWTNITIVLLGIASTRWLLGVTRHLPPRPRGALLVALLVCSLAVSAAAGAVIGPGELRHISADTEVGRARLIFADVSPGGTDGAPQPARDAAKVLNDFRPFDLPADFRLEEWDVLFVASEAIRWDDTTLWQPELQTTPNMVKWRDRGALEFRAAYAPASGTLQTLTSWFSLVPPSCGALDLYKPHWSGKLRPEAHTAAEIFAAADRHTFWIGHNFRNLFVERMHGFEQGFDHVWRKIEMDRKKTKPEDDETGDMVVEHLRSLSPDERFFGFVMFSSPHFRYRKHFDDMPSKGARNRYRQEIRKVDQQLGKILGVLERTGRLDRTIVVITADHGEEFKDHGATGHNRKLYDESIRVPMLLWLPGATVRDPDLPMANALVLPWLMLHDHPAVAEPTAKVLAEGWAPMLDATEGGVIGEILRGKRSLSSVVTPRTKLIYNVGADRAVAFDRVTDPKEKKKRYELTRREQGIIDGYVRARADCERFVDTGKRPPKPRKE